MEHVASNPSLFVAGGIGDAVNWQPWTIKRLEDNSLTIINLRRTLFSDTPGLAELQTAWDYLHRRRATAKLFWFPPQTLCPIALCELGAASTTNVPLFVGVDPDYKRKLDVVVQLRLARPDVVIINDLDELAQQVLDWAAGLKSGELQQ